jgi:hypothetical protein
MVNNISFNNGGICLGLGYCLQPIAPYTESAVVQGRRGDRWGGDTGQDGLVLGWVTLPRLAEGSGSFRFVDNMR